MIPQDIDSKKPSPGPLHHPKAFKGYYQQHSEDVDDEDDDQQRGRSTSISPSNITSSAIFSIVCICATLGSGGLIIGVGPFIERMVKDGYFADRCDGEDTGCPAQYDAMNPIFNGGFQIMTWATCLAGLCLNTWGPRVNAVLGLLILSGGCRILAVATTDDGAYVWMVAYGMIGAGGNFLYISSFHFANLFSEREVPIGLLGGIFNLSGLIFMALNIPGLDIHTFFTMYFYIGIGLACLVMVLYPDKALQPGDGYRIKWPSMSHIDCCTPWRELFQDEVTESISSRRFIYFSILFGWCTMVNVVIGGLMATLSASKSNDEKHVTLFNGYVYPAVGNSTFLFTPFVGYLIQKTGFSLSMLCNVIVTQICIALCWLPTLYSQYVMLVFFNLIQAFAYTMEFTYIQLTYPPQLYGPLIAFVVAFQGVIGLIAWPGLSPNPFGATAFTPVLLICLIPSFLLYYVAWHQKQYDDAAKQVVLGKVVNGSSPTSKERLSQMVGEQEQQEQESSETTYTLQSQQQDLLQGK